MPPVGGCRCCYLSTRTTEDAVHACLLPHVQVVSAVLEAGREGAQSANRLTLDDLRFLFGFGAGGQGPAARPVAAAPAGPMA